jgi:transposase-like protein
MSAVMEEDIKRWTARRKAALVLQIIQGKTTVAEASRSFDLALSEIEEGRQARDGKRAADQAAGGPRGIRAAAEGASGGIRGGDAGVACRKKLQSLLGEDEK